MSSTVSLTFRTANPGASVTADQVTALVAEACPLERFRDRRVLLIVPDGTRTAPVGLMFRALHERLAEGASAFDVLIALGTHPPMSEPAICQRLEMSPEERRNRFGRVRFHNHAWDCPEALREVGRFSAAEVASLTDGLFSLEVPVSVNRLVFDYDEAIIVGPVFPHEVVGFSGGNKYLFPGIGGAEILNFFHWLGAVVTNPMIIGQQWTPVRQVVERAAAMVPISKLCFCLVVDGRHLAGVFAGPPTEAWERGSDLSRERHIVRKPRPFHTILSCAPRMYDDLWTGGKCMYKLEPVLADDGELIIYAPHITEVSVTHGHLLMEIGYHCRDYFLRQWDRFRHYPWGLLAHSSHVKGIGRFDQGCEYPRARVTLATGIDEATCRRINLGYRDPRSLRLEDFAERETEGVLLVPKAGEMLYHLDHPPKWAGGDEPANATRRNL
jgi:nickel-dependent lactate racemase